MRRGQCRDRAVAHDLFRAWAQRFTQTFLDNGAAAPSRRRIEPAKLGRSEVTRSQPPERTRARSLAFVRGWRALGFECTQRLVVGL